MAKSLRSKRMRKNRAVKRVKNSKLEMDRLKKALINDPTTITSELVTLTNPASSATEKSPEKEKKKKTKGAHADDGSESEAELITVETGKDETRTFNSKTMKDLNGQYPIWMHPRKIKAIKNKHKKTDKHQTIKKKTIKRKSKKRHNKM